MHFYECLKIPFTMWPNNGDFHCNIDNTYRYSCNTDKIDVYVSFARVVRATVLRIACAPSRPLHTRLPDYGDLF